jgi:6-phospho-beta-glucosidase
VGCVPSYYLRYFYAHDEVVAEQRGTPARGQTVALMEAELLKIYADPTVTTKPALLSQRGGAFYSEAAIGLIGSLFGTGSGPAPHSANVRNNGTFDFLPDEAVIEVTCDVSVHGPRPRPVGRVAPELSGLIGHVSAYESLAVDAAIRGGRERVYRALLAHPLVGQHTLAAGLTDRLLAANAAHLRWAK